MRLTAARAARLDGFNAAASSALPPAVQAAVANPESFASNLYNGYVPLEVTEYIVRAVLEHEGALLKARTMLRKLVDLGTTTGQLAAWREAQRNAELAHNEFKFFCMLVPAMRNRLRGSVIPVDLGMIYSGTRTSFWPVVDNKSTAKFILQTYLDDIEAIDRQGSIFAHDAAFFRVVRAKVAESGVLAGVVSYSRGLGAFGGALIVVALVAAAIIAVALSVYLSLKSTTHTRAIESDNATTQALAKLEAEGKVPKGTTQKHIDAAAGKTGDGGDSLDDLITFAKVGGAIALIAIILPTILNAARSGSARAALDVVGNDVNSARDGVRALRSRFSGARQPRTRRR